MSKNKIVKPSTLPGFMELLPEEQILMNFMRDTIRKNYEKFGFVPIDTPIIEKSEILFAKGGGDTEKQIFEIKREKNDQALRFDLTVPLAKYVALNASHLTFPFKRYQIGKVFRGERNQKGRFREFYQCDIDIIGNEVLDIANDAQIPSIIYSTFKDLGFDKFTIRINNRKLLNGFFEYLEIEDKAMVLRTVDKIEKIGEDKVKEELSNEGIFESKCDEIINFINIKGTNEEILKGLRNLNIENESFNIGLNELDEVCKYIDAFGVPSSNYQIDLTIARGLDYYTGTVYETILDEYKSIGSVCSGGRYDNLAGYYTKQKLPGVGISIGLTRLFYQLREAKILKDPTTKTLTKVLVVPMDEDKKYSIEIASKLREAGIISQVYFDSGKLKKKLNYANKLGIKYVIIIGEEEKDTGILTLKDMETSSEFKLCVEDIIEKIK